MVLCWLLAHQGGWDELMLVSGPVLVFAGLLALARRRALSLKAAANQANRAADGDENRSDFRSADDD